MFMKEIIFIDYCGGRYKVFVYDFGVWTLDHYPRMATIEAVTSNQWSAVCDKLSVANLLFIDLRLRRFDF